MHSKRPIPKRYTLSDIPIPETYRQALKLMLSQSGPRAAVAILLLAAVSRAWIGGWLWLDSLIALVVIGGWSFIEWGIHNYILHANPLPLIRIRLRSILSRIHTGHHRDPWGHKTLFFKWFSVLIGWFLIVSLAFIVLPLGPSITLASSFILMLEKYEWFHVLAHSHVQIESKLLKAIVENHHRHHHKDPNKFMGVTSIVADIGLGTRQ